MVEINKNTQIEKVAEATEYTALNKVQDDLKAYETRLNSMMHKNDTLQEKLKIVNGKENRMTLVIPTTFIKDAIAEQITKMQDDLIEKVEIAEETLQELNLIKNKEALEDLEELSNFTDRLDEIEYKLDDKAELRDIDDELDSRLYDYKEEYEISDMIEEAINNIDDNEALEEKINKTIDNLSDAMVELNSKVDALTAKNNNMLSRVIDWIKGLFTPQRND